MADPYDEEKSTINPNEPVRCSACGKVVTTLVHCAFAGAVFALIANRAQPFLALQPSLAHIAVLLGVWGPRPGSFKHLWVPSPAEEKLASALFFAIGFVEFVGVAILGFGVFEPDWSFLDRLWFCFVLLTTVGYGNSFTPSTPAARMFTLCWALYGLFIFGAGSNIIITAIKATVGLLTRSVVPVHIHIQAS